MYMTTREIATEIGMDPETVRKWLRGGKIPGAVKPAGTVQGSWRISREDFENWMKTRVVSG